MIQPYGPITVPSPGTPVRVTHAEADPSATIRVHGFLFQALQANTGPVYIGVAGMNKTTGVGVCAVLPTPSETSLPTFSAAVTISMNGLQLNLLYVDADNPDNGALATVLVA